jgi:hypothetical protein
MAITNDTMALASSAAGVITYMVQAVLQATRQT